MKEAEAKLTFIPAVVEMPIHHERDRLRASIDENGNAILTGSTFSSDFPTTSGAYDEVWNGNQDFFVLKLSADGTTEIYGTFVGGPDNEGGTSIAVDASGNAIFVGTVTSSNVPSNLYTMTNAQLSALTDDTVSSVAAGGGVSVIVWSNWGTIGVRPIGVLGTSKNVIGETVMRKEG